MKKIKILILTTVVVMFSLSTVTAQEFYFGVRGGLNFTDITKVTNSKMKVGGNLGLMGGYQFSNLLALETNVLYSFQGCYNGEVSKNSQINLDYLKIPVLAKINIFKSFYVEGGVSFNFLTSALIGKTPQKGLNSFDLSIPVGVGCVFFRHLLVGLRYDISTVHINPPNNGVNSVFSLNVGWIF